MVAPSPAQPRALRTAAAVAALASLMALGGCATTEEAVPAPAGPAMTAGEARTFIAGLVPSTLADRGGWATDVYAAITVLGLPATAENICAVVAITEQESSFSADPAVPNLPALAWREIERRREAAGIPTLVLDAALALPSSNGKSYRERIDGVRTERQLSDVFEDFIGRVPLGTRFLADRNPVRTGGPMQVSIAFAEAFAKEHPYPYPVQDSIRHEVFTRRGGLYFGTAHLLLYPAAYDRMLYRFADFNAGRYASRNAAFQNAVTEASGVPLAQDGDLLRYDDGTPAKEPGATEHALRALAARLELDPAEIRRDLEQGQSREFERTRLYARVFALAERRSGTTLPRAMVPRIELQGPKLTRRFTTEGFANRVAQRHRACLARAEARKPAPL